jgi:ABC-type nitrate/sulfonate/bicarbonate transport system substrate-binding protein
MLESLRAGFVPLVDAAPLIAAVEQGFAAERGVKLKVLKQASWASLRDHLNLGHVDCAQALAPLPIAAALGLGQVRASTVVPFVLSRGGNAITLSKALADEARSASGTPELAGPKAWGDALAAAIRRRPEPITLAMVYPFSGHNFEIRYWLAAAGIHPDRDLRLVAIPPPLMVESLRAGQVDGFCVGEPWNSLAAAQDFGEIVVLKSEIFPRGIEKVLAVRPSLMAERPAIAAALLRALAEAARWCDRVENHEKLAETLAQPEYLGVAPEICLRALRGRLPTAAPHDDPEFLYFSRADANRPRREEALWLYAQMRRWGQVPANEVAEAAAMQVYRPDVYAEILGPPAAAALPAIAACDHVEFEGRSVSDYLRRFALSTPYETATVDL